MKFLGTWIRYDIHSTIKDVNNIRSKKNLISPLYDTQRKRLYGVWINSKDHHKMTFGCFMMRDRGMKLTKENLEWYRLGDY